MNNRDHPLPRPRKRHRLPQHLRNLLEHSALLEYEPQVRVPKSFGNVVEDLGKILPGVENFYFASRRWIEVRKFDNLQSHPQQFLIFCSSDPEVRSICGDRRNLRQALLSASASSRCRTNFKCRPTHRCEKRSTLEKLTSPELPYLGADWVVERDREAIARYEQTYDWLVAFYRFTQSRELSRKETTESAKRSKVDDQKLHAQELPIESGVEGLMPGTDLKGPEEPEGSTEAVVVEGSPSKAKQVVDPITKEDQGNWVAYLVERSGDEESEEVVLKAFMFEYGANRDWSFNQWLTYLKNNKSDIRRQVAKVQKDEVTS
ncbi:hypothetical protein FRC01_000168 [Tulasnella sp. 417]|nr:hypothetical protein FRC01_000168 [Tulasnella sp. 417]